MCVSNSIHPQAHTPEPLFLKFQLPDHGIYEPGFELTFQSSIMKKYVEKIICFSVTRRATIVWPE